MTSVKKHLFISILIFVIVPTYPMSLIVKNACKSGSLYGLAAAFYGYLGYSVQDKISDAQKEKMYSKDFSKIGVHYLSSSKDSSLVQDQNLNQMPSYFTKEQVESNNLKWGKHIAEGYIAPLYIALLNKKIGYGTFANKNLSDGELIGSYTGNIMPYDQLPEKHDAYTWSLPSDLVVDATEYGNELRFVNHSRVRPNVSTSYAFVDNKWHLIYIANKKIEKNEQLFVDYGYAYWTENKPYPDENIIRNYRFCLIDNRKDHVQEVIEKFS